MRLESYSLISNKMNFKKILLALAAFGTLLVTSCKENEGPITPVDITVSSDYLEIPEEGSTTSVTVKSNVAWEAEIVVSNPWGDEEANFEKNPWISVSPLAGGAGEEVSVKIEVTRNTSDSVLYQREVVIYFRTEQMIYATTTVHQLGGELKPNADTGPKPISVADFLAAEESNQWYRLSGKITGLNTSNDYGNFTLEDATGATVYVYGLNLNETAADKTFPQIGVGEGDYVTIVARRGSYNGSPQANDAYYAPVKVTVAQFLAAPIDEDGQLYEITGVMKGPVDTEYGSFDITDETGSVYVYGLTSTPILGQSNDKSFLETGYAEGDELTIVGTRGDYKGKAEVMGPAYPVRFKGGPSVTTLDAVLGSGNTSVTITGEYEYTGKGEVTETGVAYRKVGDEEYTEVKASGIDKKINVTVTGLSAETLYEYHAYAKADGIIGKGEDMTFTTSTKVLAVKDVVAAFKNETVKEDGYVAVLGGFMEAIVVADNEAGNYYQKYAVVDGTGEQSTGVVLYQIDNKLKIGDKIRISLHNAIYSPYSGLREITFNGDADIDVIEQGVKFTVPELTAAEFNAGDWQGMYVTVTGLASSHADGTLWCDEDKEEPGEYVTTNRTFKSGDAEVLVRNTAHAEWAKLPIKAGVTGKISGAVEQYKDDLQIYPVKASDIADFTTVPAK